MSINFSLVERSGNREKLLRTNRSGKYSEVELPDEPRAFRNVCRWRDAVLLHKTNIKLLRNKKKKLCAAEDRSTAHLP